MLLSLCHFGETLLTSSSTNSPYKPIELDLNEAWIKIGGGILVEEYTKRVAGKVLGKNPPQCFFAGAGATSGWVIDKSNASWIYKCLFWKLFALDHLGSLHTPKLSMLQGINFTEVSVLNKDVLENGRIVIVGTSLFGFDFGSIYPRQFQRYYDWDYLRHVNSLC